MKRQYWYQKYWEIQGNPRERQGTLVNDSEIDADPLENAIYSKDSLLRDENSRGDPRERSGTHRNAQERSGTIMNAQECMKDSEIDADQLENTW